MITFYAQEANGTKTTEKYFAPKNVLEAVLSFSGILVHFLASEALRPLLDGALRAWYHPEPEVQQPYLESVSKDRDLLHLLRLLPIWQ